jgi:cytochrome c peroxidase
MQISQKPVLIFMGVLLLVAGCVAGCSGNSSTAPVTTAIMVPNLLPITDATGMFATYSTAGVTDESLRAFFQPLGTNGRSCATCHQFNQGQSISAAATQTLFNNNSADPLFDALNGANCPTAAAGDSNGRSLLLKNGLIRASIGVAANAQFTLTVIHDPYGCAMSTSASGQTLVSIYRRPLPTSGLPYISDVLWDARETPSGLGTGSNFTANLDAAIMQTNRDAIALFEGGTTAPTAAQITDILTFEQGLYTAQATDTAAGSLSANGATGGPSNFAAVMFYPGINDILGGDPTGKKFNGNVFDLYNAWAGSSNAQQASINRGQTIFNTAPMKVSNVRGVNDSSAFGNTPVVTFTCSVCHDTPDVGSHSVSLPMDIGTGRIAADESDASIIAGLAQLSAPDVPIYQITGCKDVNGNPVVYTTTDPGKGLSTGLCSDINRLKVPSLRGLAARAPYFHSGAAGTLPQLVDFYNARFQMNLTAAQQTDLVNFLNAL